MVVAFLKLFKYELENQERSKDGENLSLDNLK